jgi:hypothetical protein
LCTAGPCRGERDGNLGSFGLSLTLCSTERDSNGADSREFEPNSLKLSFNFKDLGLVGGDGEIRTLGTL